MATIGTRIKKARLKLGMSQVELAQAANVSQPTVANWENDSHIPRQKALGNLATILRAAPHWLQSGIGDNPDGIQSTEQYLKRTIRHIPICKWPDPQQILDGQLMLGEARDYLALSTAAAEPFVLIANDPNMAAVFPIGVAIVFDKNRQLKDGQFEDGKCYLFERDGNIILRRWQSEPDRLEALPNLSAVNAEFMDERPRPLARAILSLRKH